MAFQLVFNYGDVLEACGKVRGCSFLDIEWKSTPDGRSAIESVQYMIAGILNCPFSLYFF